MSNTAFFIRETCDHNGAVIYEVWSRNIFDKTECLLAETNTRAEARELIRRYASE